MTPYESITAAFNAMPTKMASPEARLILLAIQLQEDPQQLRKQIRGPARGLWMFEAGGGVRGVLQHETTSRAARDLCARCDVLPDSASVWASLEENDLLAAGFARLLLWTDPEPLPKAGEVRQAFDLYLRTWRPGAYTRGTPAKKAALWTKWQLNYAQVMDLIAIMREQAGA